MPCITTITITITTTTMMMKQKIRLKKLFSKNKSNPWLVLDQSFFTMFLTFSLIEFTNVGAGLIDGLIVSNFLDTQAMAAAGIAHPIFSIAGIFGGMFATGMQTLCSRELGRGDVKAFNRLFSAVMILGTAFSLILTVGVLFSARPLAMLLGASGKGASLAEPAAHYLRGVGIGLPSLIMTGVLAAAIHMDSGRRLVMTAAVVGSVANVVLDCVAVVMNMGMFGIGLATALGQYIGVAVLVLHFTREDIMLRFVPLRTSLKEIGNLLSCGTEKALRRLGNVIRPIMINKLIIFYGGAMAMTAMSVESSLCDFSQFFAVGLADAAALLAGVLFGEMNDEGIEETGRCVHRYCARFCGTICVLLLIFARPVAKLYIPEEGELLNLTTFAVRMIALEAPLYGLLRPRIAYMQAVNRIRNMQVLTALSSLFYVVMSAFVLGTAFGAYGVLACLPMSDFLSLTTVWLYYAVKNRRLVPTREDYLALPEDFHRSPADVIHLDIRHADDISVVSEQIHLFCRGHKIDEDTSYSAALCFEELASNTIEHGFQNCKKEPGIKLRMVYDSGELILRMLDNCPAYNVERQIAMTVNEGKVKPTEALGLKTLGGMASNIHYVHSLENNSVILRFPLAEQVT